MEIAQKIKELNSNLTEIKTIQNTQNDSYIFYRYRSENLWGRTWNSITAEFIPDSKPVDEVVCNFMIARGNAVQIRDLMETDTQNPLKAYYLIAVSSGDWGSGQYTFPDWIRFCYISCYANCAGRLNLIFN